MEQSIDTGDGAPSGGPKGPIPPLTKVEPAPKKNTTEALIDSALSFLSDEKADNDNDREAPLPKKRAPKEEPEVGEEGEEFDEEPAADEGPGEDEGEEQPETDEDEEPVDTGKGSKEDPFKVNDLPADKYIEIKVDGQKQVVSLAELSAGYIREQTFNARLNQTHQLTQQATQIAQEAKQVKERTREEFREFISDPEQIFSFFLATEEREKVFEAAAHKYARLLRQWAEKPGERVAWERKRNHERLQMEREAWQQQKEAEEAAKRKQEADAQAKAIFEPGWQTGLRKAGFPTPTKELFEEVMVRVNQKAKTGQMITSDDIAEYTYRACKLLELTPANQKPRPRAPQRTSAPEPRRTSTSRGRDPWAGKSTAEKRKDPDYFLRGLREKDFR